jgi:hypothetical protein
VAAHRQFQAAAEGEPVDHGDHRLGHAFHPSHHAGATQGEVTALHRREWVHLGDIRPGDEGLGARAGEDHNAHGRVVRGGVEG